MDKREREDILIQAREKVKGVIDEVNREDQEAEVKRQLAQLWSTMTPELRAQFAQEQPEAAKQMSEMMGTPKGSPWGSLTGTKGR